MEVNHFVTLYLTAPTATVIEAVQGDGVRVISAQLMEAAEPWPVPEGVTAGIGYELPDKTGGYYDQLRDGTPACMIAGNLVTAAIDGSLTAIPGNVKLAIVLRDGSGGQVATFPITMRVAKRPGRIGAEEMAPVSAYEGMLLYGGPGGEVLPLKPGTGLSIRDGVLHASGGGGDSGQNLTLDTTLTQSGKAADAKATGDEIKRVVGLIPSIEGLAKTEEIPTKPEDIGAQPKGDYVSPDDIPKVPGWAMQASKPAYTASEVGADPTGTAASAVSAHNTNAESHRDIRLEIKTIREQLADFLDADEETLNELSELIAAISANQTSIAQLTTGKVSVSDIIDNLTTNVANKPLSAAQGVVIKGLIDGLSSGKLDASKLSEAINTALAQAKANGEFDGAKGDPGRGIKSIARTSGNGAAGTTDTYTITYTDSTTSTFQVRNGSNGTAGQAATLEITGATALAYGAAPTVTEESGSTAQARRYKLGIPEGKPGGNEDETPTVVLPRKLYAVAGHEYVLYYANILRAMRPEDFVVTATFADSSALLALKPLYSNMLRFTPTADHVGEHSITITVKSRRTWATVAAKTVTLIISADATRTDRRVMFIGDSLTYASVYAAEIQRMSGDGIMAVGTVSHAISFDGGSVRIESEGRNSAASYDYVSKQSFAGYSNPFYNPGVEYSLDLDKKYTSSLLTLDNSGSVSKLRHHFDFAYYMEINGAAVGELDAVFINLGTNGGNKSAYESVYIAFDAMIERIRAYSSDLPIFVHMFPPKSEAGSTDRGANGTFSGWVNERTWYYDIIQTFIDRYDNDPRVIVVPTYTMLDPVFDYKRETVAVSARSTDTITIGQTDGTHPATSGYLHMADSYYNALQALWSGGADTRYYTVSYNLGANVHSSNAAATVAEGASYNATLTAADGYELESVVVTMSDSTVAVTGGNISIPAVTGDIIITATAAEVPSGPANLVDPSTANDTNPNLALDADEWVNNYTVSGSNETMALVASSGRFVSDMFPISDDAKVRIKGMDMSSSKRSSNKMLVIMNDGRIFRGMAMPIGEAGTTAVDQDLIASEGTMLVTISKFGQAASWPGKAYARVMGYAKNGDNNNVFVTVE